MLLLHRRKALFRHVCRVLAEVEWCTLFLLDSETPSEYLEVLFNSSTLVKEAAELLGVHLYYLYGDSPQIVKDEYERLSSRQWICEVLSELTDSSPTLEAIVAKVRAKAEKEWQDILNTTNSQPVSQ